MLSEALGVSQELASKFPAVPEYQSVLLNTRISLGKLYGDTGRFDEAQEAFRQAQKEAEALAARFPHISGFRTLTACSCAEQAAYLTRANPSSHEARRAAPLAKRATELLPQDPRMWRILAVASYRAGDWNGTLAALDKVAELQKGLDGGGKLFLAMANWQLGNKDLARTLYAEAARWMDENKPPQDDLRRYRAEAAELLGITTEPTPNGKREPPKK